MKKRYTVKRIWVILFAVAAILAAVGGTLAIYTSQVYQRAVVRNRYNDVIRFSSDILTRVSVNTKAQESYYPVDPQQENPGIQFTIYNYDRAKSTLFNELDIEYTITFLLENTSSGDCSIKSKYGDIALRPGEKQSLSGKLTGGKHSSDIFTFRFPQDALSTDVSQNPKLTVTVEPTKLDLTQGMILTGTLIPIAYGTTQGFQARLEFPDSARSTPGDFAAYNVLVSVSGGKGNVEILWNSMILEIDPFFSPTKATITYEKNETSETGKMTIPMDSTDETASYLIPFYKKTPAPLTWQGWLRLEGETKDIIRLGEFGQS